MDEQIHERVRDVIRSIPAGQVATYGDVAAVAKAPSPRIVGRILAEDGHDLPWQRVLRANGTPAPHLADEQLQLLREEGVAILDGKIDFAAHRWEESPAAHAKAEDDSQPGLF